jgi:hypothetical protein
MTIASNPPIFLPLEGLTRDQKLEVREWLDRELEEAKPQDWHFEVLAEREQQILSGEMKLIPLEQFAREMEAEFP